MATTQPHPGLCPWYSLWMLLLVLVGCDADGVEPDAAPPPGACDGVEPVDFCEAINEYPGCFDDPCPDPACLVRACDNERLCQDWLDCTSPTDPGPHPCFQCRTLFTCECALRY